MRAAGSAADALLKYAGNFTSENKANAFFTRSFQTLFLVKGTSWDLFGLSRSRHHDVCSSACALFY